MHKLKFKRVLLKWCDLRLNDVWKIVIRIDFECLLKWALVVCNHNLFTIYNVNGKTKNLYKCSAYSFLT